MAIFEGPRVFGVPCADDCRCYHVRPSRSESFDQVGRVPKGVSRLRGRGAGREVGSAPLLRFASCGDQPRVGVGGEQRSAEPTAARRSRQWSDLSERTGRSESRFSNASELDVSWRWRRHGPIVGIRGKSTGSTLGAVAISMR
jgi:hypothetical protein